MLNTQTHPDSRTLIWSPTGQGMGYITQTGLKVYLNDPYSDQEAYVTLADGRFTELGWSPDGGYLAARRSDGLWLVFAIGRLHAWEAYRVVASSLEWLGNSQMIYVPDQGGLVLVYMGDTPTRVILAG